MCIRRQPFARTFAAILLLALPAAAQLQWGGAPPSLAGEAAVRASLSGPAPTASMDPVDVGAFLAEDALAGKDAPFRFGATLPVDLGLDGAGQWTVLPGGDRVWRLRVASPGAFSIGLLFGDFALPPGAQLWVFDDSLTHVLGAYDERNNKENGEFAIEPVPGDAVTLEYLEPRAVAGQGLLRLSGVVHDYRDLYALIDKGAGPGDAAGACNNDVNCPEGAPWDAQTRAVTLLIIGGGLCTGALINNTANDGTQYYISANHCGSLSNAVFRFGYEKSGCGSGSAPTNKTVQGSTQMAASSSLDVRLVKITEAIPTSYSPYYLGWNRGTAAPPNTLTIHHPQGDVKKISFDNNAPTKSGSQWRIVQWDDGVTEPGSSGCPLLDNAGRFIGQLYGGAATCSYPYDDYYGRLDSSWNTVKSWLDPLNNGATTLEGFDPAGGGGGQPPAISGVTPASVQAFQPAVVTLSGSNFSGATTVSVGGVNLATPGGFTVVSPTSITFTPPTLTVLGAQGVTVTTANGTSNSATLTYTETLPPKMTVPSTTFAGQALTWNYGGGGNDSAYLLIALSSATFPYNGYNLLSGYTIFNVQVLPASGVGSFAITVPSGFSFFTFWSQVADLQNGTGAFLGATPVASTLIIF
ncbi:MAG: hypothetical protein FJ296_06260 [Planctomycetes bacterium]|nr:hypothetical protein [Planctomycetota bacterium]